MEQTKIISACPQRWVEERHDELSQAWERVSHSSRFLNGGETAAFETDFANYLGADLECVGLASGTDALILALQACGIRVGDEVIVAGNAGGFSTAATLAAGGSPVLADVDASSALMTTETVTEAVTAKTRAVVLTHLYGRLADVREIRRALPEHVRLIEDAAQAHGARFTDGSGPGCHSDAAAFSFYPTKNLGGLCDSGAVVTSDPQFADDIRSLRFYGKSLSDPNRVELLGGRVSRMDEFAAAVLGIGLADLDRRNQRRREIKRQYGEALTNNETVRMLPLVDHDVSHLSVLACEDRQGVSEFLSARGIETAIHYAIPDHRQPAWQKSFGSQRAPQTEILASKVLSLPSYPELTPEEVNLIVQSLTELP